MLLHIRACVCVCVFLSRSPKFLFFLISVLLILVLFFNFEFCKHSLAHIHTNNWKSSHSSSRHERTVCCNKLLLRAHLYINRFERTRHLNAVRVLCFTNDHTTKRRKNRRLSSFVSFILKWTKIWIRTCYCNSIHKRQKQSQTQTLQ